MRLIMVLACSEKLIDKTHMNLQLGMPGLRDCRQLGPMFSPMIRSSIATVGSSKFPAAGAVVVNFKALVTISNTNSTISNTSSSSSM